MSDIEFNNPRLKPPLHVALLKPQQSSNPQPQQDSNPQPTKSRQPSDAPLPILLPDPKPPSDAIQYVVSSELSVPPRFPGELSASLAAALSGVKPQTILLRLQISKSGEVKHVILDTAALSDIEVHLLVETLHQLKFDAGILEGIPVHSEMNLEIKIPKTSGAPDVK